MRCTTTVRRGHAYTYYYHYTDSGRRAYYDANQIDQQVLQGMQACIATLGDNRQGRGRPSL
jgi:hypothetical protein